MDNWKYCLKNEKGRPVNKFWENAGYPEYIEMHGEHFNDRLSEWASGKLYPEEKAKWSIDDVKRAYKQLGFEKPGCYTWGDVAFCANMTYAVYINRSLKNETECIINSYVTLTSDWSYPGMVFARFTSDVMGKNMSVPWKDMM